MMKKSIVAIVLAAATTFGFSAMAQNDSDNCKSKCVKTEQCDKSKPCDKTGNDCKKQLQCKRNALNNFEGLNLTDNQKTALEQLNKSHADKTKAMHEQDKAAKKEMKSRRDQNKRDYLSGVKQVLTPEQYVVYLENIVITQSTDQNKMMPKADKAKSHHRHGGEHRHHDSKKIEK